MEAYVAAFNQGDAKALAAMWSPEAVYTNPISGEQVVGREAIEKQFAGIFADAKGAQARRRRRDPSEFVSPNVAVEQGTAKVVVPDQAPRGVRVHGRLRQARRPVVVGPRDRGETSRRPVALRTAQRTGVDDRDVDRSGRSRPHRNDLPMDEEPELHHPLVHGVACGIASNMSGMQIVGWDPAAKQIRSWVFDSDGGFGEGLWNKKDNRWYIQSTGTSPDGSKSSFVNIITYVDDNTFTWQSVNRVAGGEILPNVDEVVVVRQSARE